MIALALERPRNLLGRFTMYRLVTLLLLTLVAASFGYAAAGVLLPAIFGLDAMVLTLVVLVGSSVLADWLLGRVLRVSVQLESALITGLLLWFLYWPSTQLSTLGWLAVIAILAQLSKFVIAVHQRHLINPVAAGVVISLIGAHYLPIENFPYPTWWIANSSLTWLVVLAAVVLWWRTGRFALAATFVVFATAFSMISTMSTGLEFAEAIRFAVVSSPIFFFAGFMLTEPLTLPPRKWQKLAAAALAAVVFTWPLLSTFLFGEAKQIWVFASTYELTLVITGLFAFACRQRAGDLELLERRSLGDDYFEYRFKSVRPVTFEPGQYGEFQVQHAADLRGKRRMFSFVSTPGEDVKIAMREPRPGSSFKQALASATTVRLTSVHGDFLWPKSPQTPLLLVAGGIGITPFVSQLHEFVDEGRDVVVIHAVHDLSAVPYRDELSALGVDVHVVLDKELTVEQIRAKVPDLDRRTAMVSGSPAVVDSLSRGLARHTRSVKIDSFLGY
ncbi:MAG TPA: FAD-dependent oxidoreductase [Aeromicrobium sp.]|nr:FAD-dependent oxidoreductase [Aeromicrobium sp.]